MSDIIRLLPDSVANQIAAGEVIQRPASIVKELMENSIDAEAKTIDVLVTDAGKTCIQVIDDGKGMTGTDARLSFERHATSKISKAADLFELTTMGFRGEALASIAAIAQVELKTNTGKEELGTRVVMAGSRLESHEPVACPKGSNFSVKNLFFNVPARRKFLKANSTELNTIIAEFERIVLVNPDISFTLRHNGVELYNLPVTTTRQRVLNLFGKKMNQQLLSLEVQTTLVKISGFIAKPDAARKKGAHQYFFVNNRYMRHPYFHKAVMDAYEQLIPPGEQVSYFIYFDIDPANIDVNIHPTKTEIKFESEQAIWQILSAVIKETLGKFNAVPSIDFDTEDMPDIPVHEEKNYNGLPEVKVDTGFNPFRTGGQTYSRAPVEWQELYTALPGKTVFNGPDYPEETGQLAAPSVGLYGEEKSTTGNQHFQFKARYILTSVKSGLMFIDQHRAHINVLYNNYISRIAQKKKCSQGLLFPEIVQLTASEAVILETLWEDLAFMGFELSNLGGGSYSINGVPAEIEGLDPGELIRDMLHTAAEKGSKVKDELNSLLALSLARAAAIVYGQVLSGEEMVNLVDALFACPTPNYTPDGKIILSVLKEEEIQKMFR